MKDLRRVAVAAVIGSFSLAALLGIVALLGPGAFGETQGRILLTTFTVGLESIAVLCYLALVGHRAVAVAWAGAVASAVATVTTLAMVWGDLGDAWQLMLVATILAVTLAQASLLLAFVDGTGRDVPLVLTLAAAAGVAAMLVSLVLGEDLPGAGFGRLFGVLAILDVLGTVVLIALGAFGRVAARSDGPPRAPLRTDVAIEQLLDGRVRDLAEQRGTSTSVVVREALEEYLERH